ncbi:MAG: hypothetical protein AAGJ52_02735 [Pseudomonadota bacterium]
MRRFLLLILPALLILSACAGAPPERERQERFQAWESIVRWAEHKEGLLDFIHPDWLADNPISMLDVDRLQQFRVTEYRVRQVIANPDGLEIERRVQMRLYHIHTARERIIDHREVWRYDEEMEIWMLHSGIPDPRRS